jgi:hypothetical protein
MGLTSTAQQVDLYNKMVMTFIFGEPGWESAMTPRK